MLENNAHLDTDIAIPAPEYIVFRYNTAGPISRFFAVLLDHIFIILCIIMFTLAVSIFLGVSLLFGANFTAITLFILMLFFFIMNWFYFFLFEWLNRGRTPGKIIFSLRVVSLDGTSLDTVQIMIRNLLRIADMFPLTGLGIIIFLPSYLVASLSVVASGRTFQRLGDLAAGTIVIRENRHKMEQTEAVTDASIIEIAGQLNMRLVPSLDLTQALNDFVSRRKNLSQERLHEIAGAEQERLRYYFGAEHIKCAPEELLYAAHYYLFHLSREEFSGSQNSSQTSGIVKYGRR